MPFVSIWESTSLAVLTAYGYAQVWPQDHLRLHANKEDRMLLAANPGYSEEQSRIVPSVYAERAKEAGLELIAWTLERSGPMELQHHSMPRPGP
jgi:hypothetical protein